MAPVRIVWSDEALADLTEIHDYIARDSPRYALIVDPAQERHLPDLAKIRSHFDAPPTIRVRLVHRCRGAPRLMPGAQTPHRPLAGRGRRAGPVDGLRGGNLNESEGAW